MNAVAGLLPPQDSPAVDGEFAVPPPAAATMAAATEAAAAAAVADPVAEAGAGGNVGAADGSPSACASAGNAAEPGVGSNTSAGPGLGAGAPVVALPEPRAVSSMRACTATRLDADADPLRELALVQGLRSRGGCPCAGASCRACCCGTD